MVKSLACSGSITRLKIHSLVHIGSGGSWHLPLMSQLFLMLRGLWLQLAANNKAMGVPALMSDKIECSEHGIQEETFVCCHLAESLQSDERIGFYYSDEPRGDAWCSACEKVRISEGGDTGDWNDVSEAFAQIRLLCGACYDKVKHQNGF